MRRIDELILQRNAIVVNAETQSEEAGDRCWAELGVANGHIERVLHGVFALSPAVERDIGQCFRRVRSHGA